MLKIKRVRRGIDAPFVIFANWEMIFARMNEGESPDIVVSDFYTPLTVLDDYLKLGRVDKLTTPVRIC